MKKACVAEAGFDCSSVKADQFEMIDNTIRVKGAPDHPWLRLEFGRLLRAVHFQDRGNTVFTEEAFYEPPTELPDWKIGKGNMSVTYTYGTQSVEVEVDEETGDVRIVKLVSVIDVG